jgi:hypothetical protein
MPTGDHVRGELSPTAKLTAQDVLLMRELHDAGKGLPAGVLAWAFGVTPTSVTLIITGRSWTHIGGPTRPVRPHRLSRVGTRYCSLDGIELTQDVDRDGFVVWWCEGCKHRRTGRCMDCGGKVQGRAWRCPAHRYAAYRRQEAECFARHREEYAAAARRRYFADPLNRQRKLEYKKAWRQQNPKKVMAQRRRQRLRGRGGWATREKYLAYHAAYRAEHREKKRAQAREQYYREHPTRPQPVCLVCEQPIPWDGRFRPRKRCDAHNPFAKYRKHDRFREQAA